MQFVKIEDLSILRREFFCLKGIQSLIRTELTASRISGL